MTTNVSGWLPNLLGPVEVQDDGTAVTARAAINFIGCTVTDNEADDSTDVTPPGSAAPTGTGIPHVVSGAYSAATSLIVNADVHASAAIAGSKLVSATTSVSGSMSAADKTKLDGMQTQGSSVSVSSYAIDWSLGGVFYKTLGAGAQVFTFSNATDGWCIVVEVTGAASTLTWPTVLWAGGVAPTQTASGTDIYTFVKRGSNIFGSVVQAMA